jgi:hypothetical protein
MIRILGFLLLFRLFPHGVFQKIKRYWYQPHILGGVVEDIRKCIAQLTRMIFLRGTKQGIPGANKPSLCALMGRNFTEGKGI